MKVIKILVRPRRAWQLAPWTEILKQPTSPHGDGERARAPYGSHEASAAPRAAARGSETGGEGGADRTPPVFQIKRVAGIAKDGVTRPGLKLTTCPRNSAREDMSAV